MLKNRIRKMRDVKKGKRIIVSAIFLFGIMVFVTSCKKEISDVGLGVQPDSDLLNATVIDTFQIESSTELEDSLRTDELSNNMVGSYVDPVFGKVSSEIFTQLGLATPILSINMSATTVDSVKLQMRYGVVYGDLDPQTFSVQRITQKFYKDSAYYSNQTLTTDGVELIVPGYENIIPNTSANVVVGTDTLSPMMLLNLDTLVGKDILNAVAGGSLANETVFRDFFYGLRIASNNPSQAVNSGGIITMSMFDAQTKMIVYYTESGISKQASFPIGTSQARFSHFTHDYTGTPVESALNTPSLGQKFFYAQTMAGVRGVLKIKGIDGLKSMGNVIINKAELYLPVQYYTTDPYNVSDYAFVFYNINTEGSLGVMIDQLYGYSVYGGVYDNVKKAYVFNIGRHLQKVIKGELDNLGFVINTSGSSVSANRIVFSGQDSPNRDKPYLKVFYTKY